MSLSTTESIVSLESLSSDHRSQSSGDLEQNINELTEGDIMALIDKKINNIKRLEVENQVFQAQLKDLGEEAIQPAELLKSTSLYQKSFSSPGTFLTVAALLGDRRARGSRSSVSRSTEHQEKTLSMSNKYYVVKTELNKLNRNSKLENKQREKIIEDLQNNIDETVMCIADTTQQAMEFEQKIIKGARHPITDKVKAEKLLQFFDSRQRSQRITIQNLRMKTTEFLSKRKQISETSRVKLEVVRDVRKVDLDQRRVQVKKGQEQIQIKNEHRIRMKSMAGRAKQVLDEKMARLAQLTTFDQSLKQRLARKKGFVDKLNLAIQEVEKEIQDYEQEYARLNKELKDYCPITAFDVMKLKDSLKDAERTKKNWERHANVERLKAKHAKEEFAKPEEYQ